MGEGKKALVELELFSHTFVFFLLAALNYLSTSTYFKVGVACSLVDKDRRKINQHKTQKKTGGEDRAMVRGLASHRSIPGFDFRVRFPGSFPGVTCGLSLLLIVAIATSWRVAGSPPINSH